MAEIKEYQLFINGEWKTSTSGETIDIVSPSTEEVIARVQNGTAEEAIEALEAADRAQKEWKKLPARERADLLYKLADEIDANTEYLAEILTKEQQYNEYILTALRTKWGCDFNKIKSRCQSHCTQRIQD